MHIGTGHVHTKLAELSLWFSLASTLNCHFFQNSDACCHRLGWMLCRSNNSLSPPALLCRCCHLHIYCMFMLSDDLMNIKYGLCDVLVQQCRNYCLLKQQNRVFCYIETQYKLWTVCLNLVVCQPCLWQFTFLSTTTDWVDANAPAYFMMLYLYPLIVGQNVLTVWSVLKFPNIPTK